VYTIDIIPALAQAAADRLARLGLANVSVKQGDGYYGWEEAAPFDGTIVTAAASHIPPPLLQQLKPGARMVIPVGAPFALQHLVVVERNAEGRVRTRPVVSDAVCAVDKRASVTHSPAADQPKGTRRSARRSPGDGLPWHQSCDCSHICADADTGTQPNAQPDVVPFP
jgi:hypothetical protein